MKLHKYGTIVLFAASLAMSFIVVGCVVLKIDEQYTGIEKDALKEVECGQTTRDWVVEKFGEPSEQILADDGSEILKYKCIKKKDNKFVMFPPPIVIKDDKDVEHTVAFEVRDGIVQRYWKEK
ncbi:hypothetical protein ACFL3Q_06080 [Planctomycetota bacterium]